MFPLGSQRFARCFQAHLPQASFFALIFDRLHPHGKVVKSGEKRDPENDHNYRLLKRIDAYYIII